MKNVLRWLLFFVFFLSAQEVIAIEGLRGSTWGEVRWELPQKEGSNLILDSWVKQGVDWVRWNNSMLNTYVRLRLKADTEKQDWNNSFGPGIGISFDTFNQKNLITSVGVEYFWERFYESARTDQKVVVYLNWYGWWDLKKKQ